jgi:acetyl esterase/lipase
MKTWFALFALLCACVGAHAANPTWQPSAGHVQLPLWPGMPPDMKAMPGVEYAKTGTRLLSGKTVTGIYNVSHPTMTVYAPAGTNNGAAVVVFPGGGFAGLAIDLEGTEACDWLTSKGITCVLLKYRVPSVPYDWHCDCRPDDYQLSVPSLEDAERTIRLVRFHAAEWHVDPHRVGVIGFSAGGFLVAETSTDYKRQLYKPVDAADRESARPDFAMAIYPGHLAFDDGRLNSNVPVSRETPPTFLVQAEDDYVDGVNQSLVYYAALAKARVPAELHLYAHGGHAFGLRRTKLPITHWTDLADAWMRTIGVLPR